VNNGNSSDIKSIEIYKTNKNMQICGGSGGRFWRFVDVRVGVATWEKKCLQNLYA